MSSSLITQTIDAVPEILILGENDFLVKKIAKIFQKNQLKTVVVNQVFDIDQNKNWYKIVWVEDFAKIRDADISKKISVLKKINSPKLLLSFVFRPLEKGREEVFNKWLLQNEKTYQNLNKVISNLDDITICLGQDIFSEAVVNPFLEIQKEKLSQGILLDPQVDLFGQTLDEFLIASSVFLISPWNQERILIQGKKTPTQSIIKEIQFLYSQIQSIDLEIQKTAVLTTVALEGFQLEKSQQSSDLKEKISFFVKNLPKISIKNKVKPKKIEKNKANSRIFPPKVNKKEDKNEIRLINIPKISLSQNNKNPVLVQKQINNNEIAKNIKKQNATDPEFDERVEKLFNSKQVDKKVERVEQIADQTKEFSTKSKRKKTAFIGGVFVSGLAIGVILLSIVFFSSNFLFKKIFISHLKSDQEKLSKLEDNKFLSGLSQLVAVQNKAYTSILKQDLSPETTNLIEIYEKFKTSTNSLSQVQEFSILAFKYLFGSEVGDTFSAISASANKAELSYKDLSLLTANLEQFLDSNDVDNSSINLVLKNLVSERKSLATLQQLEPLLSTLLAENDQRTYAVLVQDNQELRPTGGFIHSIVLITVKNGVVIDQQTFSSYQLDAMLSGQVAVPEEINKYLGETNWYLRDSNWDPDFPTTANQVNWFIQKATGKTVDGVMALNIYVMEDMISALGPLEMDQYNEVVTDKNIHERAEFHSEVQLTNNENQEDYLTNIFISLYQKMISADDDSITKLLSVFEENLNQGQLLIGLIDKEENQSFETLGWSGEVLSPTCPGEFTTPCFVDTFYKVESNVGVNKANYSLQRTTTDNITLSSNSVNHHRVLKITNTSKSKAWPQGTYKSFIRFYLPVDVQLNSVSVNGSTLSQEKISQKIVHSKKVIGVFAEVPISSTTDIELDYQIPLDQDYLSYSLFDQRQSGIKEDPTTVIINHDPSKTPSLIAPQAEIVGNSITFYTDHLKHFFLGVSF